MHTLGIAKNINPNFSSVVCTDAIFLFFYVSTCLCCVGETFSLLFNFLLFLFLFFWLSRGHGLVIANKTHCLLLPKVSEWVHLLQWWLIKELDHDKDLKLWRTLQCNYFGTRTSSCWPKRQWFVDLHPFCIFVISVNMNFLNCKNGFFCKMFSTFTFNSSLCIF